MFTFIVVLLTVSKNGLLSVSFVQTKFTILFTIFLAQPLNGINRRYFKCGLKENSVCSRQL